MQPSREKHHGKVEAELDLYVNEAQNEWDLRTQELKRGKETLYTASREYVASHFYTLHQNCVGP